MEYTPDEERQIAEQLASPPPGMLAQGILITEVQGQRRPMIIWDWPRSSQLSFNDDTASVTIEEPVNSGLQALVKLIESLYEHTQEERLRSIIRDELRATHRGIL